MEAVLKIFIVTTITTVVYTQDYCNVKSCKEKHAIHTMCKYSSEQPAAACGKDISKRGLTDEEKQTIVDAHNKLRNKVAAGQESRGNPGPQPAASDMCTMTWNDEIATIAQRWANQCNFEHDQCRDTETNAVGQNIYQVSSSGTTTDCNFEALVQGWYDEVGKFDKNDVSSYKFDPKTGHYTQVVWGNTYQVGCGVIIYKQRWNQCYLVCNYAPSGNWIGEPVYKIK